MSRFNPGPHDLAHTYAHLRDGGGGEPLPAGPEFWEKLSAGAYPQLEHGRLVCQVAFDRDWDMWERHPAGEELVLLLSGAVDFVLEESDGERIVPLRGSGCYVLVPAGTWHTARVREPGKMMFVTPGRGTEHRQV